MATTKDKKKRKPGEPSPAQLRARKKFAAMAKARAKAARLAKKAAGIKTPSKKRATTAKPTKRRNSLEPDRIHTTKVRQHWRVGPESAWKRAEKAGQQRLFAMNGKPASGSEEWERLWANYVNAIASVGDAKNKGQRRAALMRWGKAEKAIEKHSPGFLDQIRASERAPKTNGSGIKKAKAQRKEFLGSPARKVVSTTVPKGAKPKGALSKMGRLMRVKVKGRSWMDFQGVPTLARDAKNKMFITGNGYKITAKGKKRNPDGFEDLGEITHIEYVATKAHLDGYPVTYVHAMGEEGGAKPHAVVNSDGLLLIEGGDYTITSRGIEN